MGYSGFLEQNVNKVTGNLHSEVNELNIHSDTSRELATALLLNLVHCCQHKRAVHQC